MGLGLNPNRAFRTIIGQLLDTFRHGLVSVVDVDTCDQATNPACAFDNYPTPPNPGAVEVNAQRQAMCAANPNYYYCKPNRSPYYATENAEVLATYDGGSPAYSLVDELDPDSGVVVTFSVRFQRAWRELKT
jgi:hypothetical protein